MSRIEAKLDKILNGKMEATPITDITQRIEKFNADALRKLGENNEPYFYFYASPKSRVSLPNFWAPLTDETSVPWLLKNPPTLRRMGWDLSVAMQEYPTAEPDAWEIMNGDRKMLNVTEKGEVFAAVTIDRMLNWGMDNAAQQQHGRGFALLINEYAFAEFIAMYFAFLEKIAERIESDEGSLRYQVSFGFVGTEGISVGLLEPVMQGIPSNGTIGPMRTPSTWHIDDLDPSRPYINAGFVIQEIVHAGFGGTYDSEYFVREGGYLIFDATSYTGR